MKHTKVVTRPAFALLVLGSLLGGACSDGAKAVSKSEVESKTADGLEQTVGQRPDSVECPEDLKAEEGETMRCVLSAGEDQIGVTLTVNSVDGDDVKWDFEVDQEMMP